MEFGLEIWNLRRLFIDREFSHDAVNELAGGSSSGHHDANLDCQSLWEGDRAKFEYHPAFALLFLQGKYHSQEFLGIDKLENVGNGNAIRTSHSSCSSLILFQTYFRLTERTPSTVLSLLFSYILLLLFPFAESQDHFLASFPFRVE